MLDMYAPYQAQFKTYGISPDTLRALREAWQAPHRHYHTEVHLAALWQGIEALYKAKKIKRTERDALIIAALYHDAVYEPNRQDNEEASAQWFVDTTTPHSQSVEIQQIIIDTKHHTPQSKLSKHFSALDMAIISRSDFGQLLRYEQQIFREYQYVDYALYKPARIALLEQFARQYPQNAPNLLALVAYLHTHRPKIGIYPGSFNPFHLGHLNIVQKAEKIFDKVIIARGINPDKVDVANDMLKLQVLRYRQTEQFNGFLTDYVSSKETDANVSVVKGLRNGDDLDYEVNQLRFMEEMKPDIQLLFITCDREFEHISSTSIKNLDRIDPLFSARYRVV